MNFNFSRTRIKSSYMNKKQQPRFINSCLKKSEDFPTESESFQSRHFFSNTLKCATRSQFHQKIAIQLPCVPTKQGSFTTFAHFVKDIYCHRA